MQSGEGWVDERIDEGALLWLGHVEMMEKDRIAKRVYVGECAGSRSVGKTRKRWVDTVKACLKKSGLDVRQAMVQYKREMVGVWGGECMGRSSGDEPLTLNPTP